jgi:hypothetical protein
LVHHHLMYVARLLRQARFTSGAVADRLLVEWAQLSQLAGTIAHDAGEHGLSQRYLTSGWHAAHTAGDRSVGVYLLTCMSACTVSRGRLADGIDSGRAARDAVELVNATYGVARSTPVAVRALAADRFAQAQAAAGNTRGFHAADEARALLDTPGALEIRPPYLTWYGRAPWKATSPKARSPWLRSPPGIATDCSITRRRYSAVSPPIRPALRAALCSMPHGWLGRMSRPVTWTRRSPPGSPRCAGCPPSAPAAAGWCCADWKPTSPPCPHPPPRTPARPTPRHPRRLTNGASPRCGNRRGGLSLGSGHARGRVLRGTPGPPCALVAPSRCDHQTPGKAASLRSRSGLSPADWGRTSAYG